MRVMQIEMHDVNVNDNRGAENIIRAYIGMHNVFNEGRGIDIRNL